MKLELRFGSPKPYDYEMILDQFSGTKIYTIRTSSVPLLEFWKDTEKRLEELFTKINIKTENPVLCFEYPTKPQKGKGKSSMTDLMIINGEDTKIAIESKFTEYSKIKNNPDAIAKWLKKGLKKGNEKNRKLVLNYWSELITPFSNGINDEMLPIIDYQFYHRTASACKETKNAIVIYQLFYDNETKQDLENYKEKLNSYVKALNPKEKLSFYIWEVEVNQEVKTLEADNENKKDSPFFMMKNMTIYSIKQSNLFKI